MKKDCIEDFIESWRSYDRITANTWINWNIRFREAGYYSINWHHAKTPDFEKWAEMHEWCKKTVGQEHYAWAGETFWFETEQAAVWFALRWS